MFETRPRYEPLKTKSRPIFQLKIAVSKLPGAYAFARSTAVHKIVELAKEIKAGVHHQAQVNLLDLRANLPEDDYNGTNFVASSPSLSSGNVLGSPIGSPAPRKSTFAPSSTEH